MDCALDKLTGELLEAEQLWLLEAIDKTRYRCPGCGISVIPASYRPENLVRPYFSARGDSHAPTCDIGGTRNPAHQGRTRPLSTSDGRFPFPYPRRLVLRDLSHPTQIDTPSPNSQQHLRSSSNSGSGKARESAHTIRPICRTFIHFPHDRRLLALSIEGIDRTDYRSAFRRLEWDSVRSYTEPRLFYAPIRWSRPLENEQWLEVGLDAGVRDERGKLLTGHRLRIEWSGWSDARKRYVRNELEVARKEAIARKAADPTMKGYVFFIGVQDSDNPALFHVTDHRLICCLVDSITYPG